MTGHPYKEVYTRITDNPADFHKVGQRIKRLFVQAKRAQLGATSYGLAARYNTDDIWDKTGEIAIDEGVSPKTFIEAVFAYNTVIGGPFPHQITGNAARRWVSEYKDTSGTELDQWRIKLRNLFESTEAAVKTYPPGSVTTIDILRNPMYSSTFPPVLICSVFPNPGILEDHGQAAVAAMEEDPSLAEIMHRLGLSTSWTKNVPR